MTVCEGLSAQDGSWLWAGKEWDWWPQEQVSRNTRLQGHHGVSCDIDSRNAQKCCAWTWLNLPVHRSENRITVRAPYSVVTAFVFLGCLDLYLWPHCMCLCCALLTDLMSEREASGFTWARLTVSCLLLAEIQVVPIFLPPDEDSVQWAC